MSKAMSENSGNNPQPVSAYLVGDVKITLHTRQAQLLLNGTWKYKRLGLWQFSKRLEALWTAHKEGDPYAAWYFGKINRMLENIQKEVKVQEEYCQSKLSQQRGIEIEIFRSPNPVSVLLRSPIPYFHLAASLLADLDYVSRQAFTLRHIGIVLDSDKLPIHIFFSLRELFSLPLEWKYTGVTRQDIEQNNQKAQLAIKYMGEVPSVILSEEMSFMFLPKAGVKKG